VDFVFRGDVFDNFFVYFHRGVGIFLGAEREVDLVVPAHDFKLGLEVSLFGVSDLDRNGVLGISLDCLGEGIVVDRVLICDLDWECCTYICHTTELVGEPSPK